MKFFHWLPAAVLIFLIMGFLFVAKAATVCNIFNGCTGTSTGPSYGQLLIGGKNGEYEYVATSTLGGAAAAVSSVFGRTGAVTAQSGDYTTSLISEGSNLYWTQTRFDNALTATTSLPKIVTLSSLSLPYTQVTGTPDLSAYLTLSAWYATTTDQLREGSTNLYFTNTRADARFIADLAATTSVKSITTLPSLSLPYSQVTGTPAIASSTLLSDANTFSGVNKFSNSSSDFSGTWQTFAPSHFQTALGFTAVPNTRALNTTYPLQGGGDLSADRTLSLAFSTSTANSWNLLQTISAASTTNLTASNFWQIGQSAGCAQYDSNGKLSSTGANCGTGSAASSTLLSDNNTFSGIDIFSKLLRLSATTSAVLGTDASGNIIATTSVGANYITGTLGTINTTYPLSGGGSFTRGGTLTLTTAPTSTLFSNLKSAVLSTDNTGTIAATTSIGTNYITGVLGTINGTSFSNGGTITVTAASSTLLGDKNTWAALQNLSNASSSLETDTRFWSTNAAISYASTTETDATTICLTGDTCRTTWPTGGAGTSGLATSSLAATWPIILSTTSGAATYSFGGLSTSSSPVIGNLAYWTGAKTLGTIASSSIAFSGPFAGASSLGALIGGTNSTVTWTGLATTSQPASSNLLVSNGGAGVYGAPTSTLTASSPLTGSFVQIGSGGSLGIQAASASQAGSMAAADYQLLHTATTTFSSPLVYTQATNAVTCPTCQTSAAAWPWTLLTNWATSTNATTTAYTAPAYFASSTVASQFPYASTTALTVTGTTWFPGSGIWNSSGNVGIGLTSPSYKLDVSGDINIAAGNVFRYNGLILAQASSTLQNFFFGNSGAIGSGTTGTNNLGAGNAALVALTSGVNNFGFGALALQQLTTGNYNVAIGVQAMNVATSTNNDIAIGASALIAEKAGGPAGNDHYNTAIGRSALLSNTYGYYNDGIGGQALGNVTTGAENDAIGIDAGYGITTGNANVAIGSNSLFTGTSTGLNIAIGKNALYNTSDPGSWNVGIGVQSLYSNVGGALNTAIGYQSGYANTTGSNNLYLGYLAGYVDSAGSTGAITGSNNIVIGTSQNMLPTKSSSNQLNIGNLIFATGIATGNTVSAGNVGVGTSTPNFGLLTLGNSSSPQIVLSDNSGGANWSERWITNTWYLGTSTATATSTPFAMSFDTSKAGGSLSVGSSTPTFPAANGLVTIGANGAGGTTTISVGKLQYDGYDSGGKRRCIYINAAGSWVIGAAGAACTQ